MPSYPAAQGTQGAGELFQILRDGRARTRAELARQSQLARSTITSRIDDLLASGLLAPVGEAASTGGRPPARFAVNTSARSVLAIDLGAAHASLAVTDLGGTVLAECSTESNIADGPVRVLDAVTGLGLELLAQIGQDASDVVGIGIGVPGPVEHATGRPANPPIMPGWHDFDIPAHLARTFDATVLVDNDVNVMALGEYVTRWPEEEHLIFVKVSTGIGSGIIVGGRLHRGAQGTAGDLGHVQVRGHDQNVPCRCGNTGCLEAIAAGPALVSSLRETGVEVGALQGLVDAVLRGDLAAIQAVRQAGRDLGGVLATYVNLINPSVIVIGGTLSEAGEFLLAGAREVVYRRSLPLATDKLRIANTSTGRRAGVLGAAAMVLDDVLSPQSIENYLARRRATAPART